MQTTNDKKHGEKNPDGEFQNPAPFTGHSHKANDEARREPAGQQGGVIQGEQRSSYPVVDDDDGHRQN